MDQVLNKLKEDALIAFESARDENALRELQNKYLGRKGELALQLKKIADMPPENRRALGLLANEVKTMLQAKSSECEKLFARKTGPDKFVDPTLPGKSRKPGAIHPISRIQAELEDLFIALGFRVLEGPELESDFFCFEALNIPRNHPARDMQDTFYIDRKNSQGEYDLVMRTHTSPMQVRTMLKYGAPLKCVVPGRVFRNEATDAVHEHTFYQMEGLMIDKNISIANLIAVMQELINGIFGRAVETRIRPGYFPFVEPGIELDIKCTICGGTGCPSCKHSGWLELLPAGMVHPRVLEFGGLDPKEWSGFAFGLGLTRLAMMKYGIGDIRHFMGGDARFLEQF
jgi:phenylalanyl-tRNA synthetase alpha chain